MSLCKLKGRVLFQGDDFIIVSRRSQILWYRLSPFSAKPFRIINIPFNLFQFVICSFPLLQRLFRFHVSILFSSHDLKIIASSGSFYLIGEDDSIVCLGKYSFSQPLLVSVDDKFLYYGDYCSNKSRSVIALRAIDLKTNQQSVLHLFSGIRHIHGVIWDNFSREYIVTTGDLDGESSLFFFDSSFSLLRKKLCFGQITRAIGVVPFQDCIFYGTDSPFQQNYLVRVDKSTLEIQKVCPLPSSCFQISSFSNGLLLSCVPEPSPVNQQDFAYLLFYSFETHSLDVVRSAKVSSLNPKLFTYTRIVIPQLGTRTCSSLFTSDHASNRHETIHRSTFIV